MPKLFFFIGFIVICAVYGFWLLRQLFTKEELGESTEEETFNSQPTLREKQLHINEEVTTLKSDLTQLEHDTGAKKREAKRTIEEADKISDDIEDKQSTINKL